MNICLDIYYLSLPLSLSRFFCVASHSTKQEESYNRSAHREIYMTHLVALFPDDKEGVSVVYFKHSFFGIIFVPLDDTGVFRKLGQSKYFRRSPAQSKDFQNSRR